MPGQRTDNSDFNLFNDLGVIRQSGSRYRLLNQLSSGVIDKLEDDIGRLLAEPNGARNKF
ncbi:hypothetical protein HMPREF2651_08815 [Corynebacterium sp. HMSC063A05]|nr:hypothetical protein HMPREF2651_08815 [Corynebacterium sp. HMSC063A05]